jgi:cyanophycinase
MDRFVQAAGGANANIVVITTASRTADSDEVEEQLEYWRSLPVAHLNVLHTRSRDIADDIEFGRPLTLATGVWFIGGSQASLADTYVGTVTERLIYGVLKRGGVVGGESAGAAIMSPVMIRRGNPYPEVGQGFGFLPGTVIDQHFIARNRQDRLLNVLADNPSLVGFGIDEGAALIVHGRQLSVVGDSEVVACLPPRGDGPAKVRLLKPGMQTDLAAFRAANARAAARFNRGLASLGREFADRRP